MTVGWSEPAILVISVAISLEPLRVEANIMRRHEVPYRLSVILKCLT